MIHEFREKAINTNMCNHATKEKLPPMKNDITLKIVDAGIH